MAIEMFAFYKTVDMRSVMFDLSQRQKGYKILDKGLNVVLRTGSQFCQRQNIHQVRYVVTTDIVFKTCGAYFLML